MPLIRDGRFAADDWLRPEPGADLPAGAKLILPLDRLTAEAEALAEAGHALGVEITNDTDPDALTPWFGRVELISVLFPKSADGRGFSMATRLRRLGFDGELRATGHLIADQYALARSCGFDTVEISEAQAARQPEAHWLEAERAMSLAYQRGYGRMRSILSARWAG
ncbi:MAG: DUF934 domain-containing protein [Rhodomicrobiaceae bacterium]